MKILLAILFSISTSIPVLANDIESYRRPARTTKSCTTREYREEYVPGTPENPGHVRNWYEYVEVPCNPSQAVKADPNTDTNDCKEGSLIGGILGAGIAASASRKKGRLWAVPAGGVTGALIGCQIDGG
tara:strand:- start:206 stop:592 length:387 start_codon:yes stop_codon:yes gene_type:complete